MCIENGYICMLFGESNGFWKSMRKIRFANVWIFHFLSIDFLNNGDVKKCIQGVLIMCILFLNIPSMYFLCNELYSFFSFPYLKSKLWPVLFLYIIKTFRGLSQRRNLLCSQMRLLRLNFHLHDAYGIASSRFYIFQFAMWRFLLTRYLIVLKIVIIILVDKLFPDLLIESCIQYFWRRQYLLFQFCAFYMPFFSR